MKLVIINLVIISQLCFLQYLWNHSWFSPCILFHRAGQPTLLPALFSSSYCCYWFIQLLRSQLVFHYDPAVTPISPLLHHSWTTLFLYPSCVSFKPPKSQPVFMVLYHYGPTVTPTSPRASQLDLVIISQLCFLQTSVITADFYGFCVSII